jgi:transposase
MKELQIFTTALGLEEPWHVEDVYFEEEEGEKKLHIKVAHKKRVKFEYDSEEYPVYDHQERTWKHLNFFQHECYLHADVPRVKIHTGKVKLIELPWAKPGSSFTLLFEYDVLNLLEGGMSASKIGQRLRVGGKRIFGIVRRHVSHALSTQELSIVKELSVDETSTKKGHNYFTILADREAKKVVGISLGKDKEAFAHALIDMEVRGADRKAVEAVTMDMSKSYISAVKDYMDQADIVFDRFHIVKKLNEAVDEIRRTEQKEYTELKKSRYLWLKNNSKLNQEQKDKVNYLAEAYPNIGTAYRLKELLKEVLDNAYYNYRVTPLNEWMKEAWKSKLEPIRKFINMLNSHWYGVKSYFKRLATNAYAERVNLKIQEIKRAAKGYRNTHNFTIMIYFHLGGLNLKTHCI